MSVVLVFIRGHLAMGTKVNTTQLTSILLIKKTDNYKY